MGIKAREGKKGKIIEGGKGKKEGDPLLESNRDLQNQVVKTLPQC